MSALRQDELFPGLRNPPGTHVINERCPIRSQDGLRLVLVLGMPWAQYAEGHRMSEAQAMASLVEQGWADQNDMARTFGCSVGTLRRYQRRFETGGLASLSQAAGYPKGHPRQPAARVRWGQRHHG